MQFKVYSGRMDTKARTAIVGAGLAGCEAALALARHGLAVGLFEMKPERFSPAHTSSDLAELVCSNSFRSDDPDSAVGELKREMRLLGSAVLRAASQTSVPAGRALAVDRERFARTMTELIEAEPLIRLVRQEITSLDQPDLAGFERIIIAAGPLASQALGAGLAGLTGQDHLYFYDAVAPIVEAASLDMDKLFWASRYQDGGGDYLNCPLERDEYFAFRDQLLAARKVPARGFEQEKHFEACLPIEVLAERGDLALAYGPLKPVGLVDPRTGRRPFAVLQLRAENQNADMYNLVGCQTKMTYPEQERIFRLLPGFVRAEFVRFGSMHRNTYVNAPVVLNPDLSLKARPEVFLAGQIAGVEGYAESAACGLCLGLALAVRILGRPWPDLPVESALGGLMGHLRQEAKHFQPSNVNYGLTPELGIKAPSKSRKASYAERARQTFDHWLDSLAIPD